MTPVGGLKNTEAAATRRDGDWRAGAISGVSLSCLKANEHCRSGPE